jgi:AraC-like DNA-binding protein
VSYDQKLLFNSISRSLQRNPCASLSDLSRELQVSPRTIQTAVRIATGKKFKDFRRTLLMAKLNSLFASGRTSAIKEFAFEVGYKSPRSFARAVRRACGLTPRELRSNVLNEFLRQPATSISSPEIDSR